MLNLKGVTLVCIDTKNIYEALCAINYSLKNINFGNVIFFTNSDPKIDKFSNTKSINIIQIPEIKSKVDYSRFCLTELSNYIDTEYCLTIQHDGFVINPFEWSAEFLNYDYIGAPWPIEWGYKNRVGNGGFCLKSKKFLSLTQEIFQNRSFTIDRDRFDISENEDYLTSVIMYDTMIENGIKFANPKIAAKFSLEHPVPEFVEKSFGFHDKFLDQNKRAINEKFVNIAI